MARFRLEVGFATHIGQQRERNEDSFAVFVPASGDDHPSALDGLLLVADGMGGERAGDRASQMAVERLHGWLVDGTYQQWPEHSGEEPLAASLRRAVHDVSSEIYRLGEHDESIRGLGSTLVMAAFAGETVTVANVGDSRCYRLRRGRIERLSVDHSLVGRHVEAGLLSPEEARIHPQRNVLTRSLGDAIPPEPDLCVEPLVDGDLFLLCTDGLTGGLEDAEILRLAERQPEPQKLADDLVARANELDGSDNITVVLGRCHEEAEDTVELPAPSPEELGRGPDEGWLSRARTWSRKARRGSPPTRR